MKKIMILFVAAFALMVATDSIFAQPILDRNPNAAQRRSVRDANRQSVRINRQNANAYRQAAQAARFQPGEVSTAVPCDPAVAPCEPQVVRSYRSKIVLPQRKNSVRSYQRRTLLKNR